jgi:hypothetical protein
MRRAAAWLVAAAMLTGTCEAQQVLRELPWTRAPEGAVLIPPRDGRPDASIRIERREGGTIRLLRIEKPPVATPDWAIVGQVRYDGVAGHGYLEMWNVFADGRYFSRTLGTDGPMGRLSGTSTWREFVLPFHSRPDTPPPVALEMNLVLPGAGTVEIGPVRLVQYAAAGGSSATLTSAWWSDRQGGVIGSAAGAAFGVLGAIVGWLASRTRARAFVLGATRAIVVLGVLALATGIVAVTSSQPYGVWYPLVLLGALACGVMWPAQRQFARRYREAEMRRLRALDA